MKHIKVDVAEVEVGVATDVENFLYRPTYKTGGSAGADVYAAEDCYVYWGKISKIPTGLVLDIPDGYEIQVRPRSGLATKGFCIVNAPGTGDSDYCGEYQIICTLLMPGETLKVTKGDRIAQFVLSPVVKASYIEIDMEQIEEKKKRVDRVGGLGSTGR